MTQMFTEEGRRIPLTAIQVGPCPIVQIKSQEKDRYNAIQIGFEPLKEGKANMPQEGHFEKANVNPTRYLKEVRVDSTEEYELGQNLEAKLFKEGDRVDVSGTSKGRGFQGGVRRHNWRGGRDSHGSMFHRAIGALSPGTGLSRVFKGKTLPGQMGNVTKTIQNLKVAKVDVENNIIYIHGGIPGPDGGLVFVKATTKTKKSKKVK